MGSSTKRPSWVGKSFVSISRAALYDRRLSNSDRVVLLELADLADWETGLLRISKRSWVRQSLSSPHTARASLSRLQQLGYIEVVHQTASSREGSLYRLLSPSEQHSSARDFDPSSARDFALLSARFCPPQRAILPRAPLYTDSFQILSDGAAELPPDDVAFKDPIGQKAVQHYVDTCMEIGYTPTEEWKSLCGRNAKKLDNSGKTLDLIWSAIERVARGRKSPSALLHVAADVEAGIPESGNYPTNGRNGYKPFRDAPLSEWEDPKNHVIG